MPFFERLKWNSVFECSDECCARLISDESIHVCKHESKAYLKAKHTNIQKEYVFADPMYILIENDSKVNINLVELKFAKLKR